MINLIVTKCDVSDIIVETIRFLSHIFLLHLISYSIEGNESLISSSILKTMLFTTIAIILYNIFVKKLFDPVMKKMKKECKNVIKI